MNTEGASPPLGPPGLAGVVSRIGPQSLTFPVRDRQVTLVAMGGKELLEWGEMQILLGTELVAAKQLCRTGKEERARTAVETVLAGNIGLVCRAAGCEPDWAVSLSYDERAEILRRQDFLNRTDLLQEWVEGFAVRGYLEGNAQ